MKTTGLQTMTKTKLNKILWLSQQDKDIQFNNLMNDFNVESLRECFNMLDGKKAVGIDGVKKEDYVEDLDGNLQTLVKRIHEMGYRPNPVREVLIPKEGKPGATRPLGISNFEDKIFQMMVQKTLESIYEPLFLDCSYGFRPGKSCHDAIEALSQHLYQNEIQVVIDIDLRNFFGTIDHNELEILLREKISDTRFLRYINRMFKAGVLSDGDLKINDQGVPQGSLCSPILSNIFGHHVIDLWFEEMVKPHCKGNVALFRYADDGVICCQYEGDALRIRTALAKRLGKFKLELNEEKTKIVQFNKNQARCGIKQETFDFLGFTFYWGKSSGGHTIPKLKTKAKAMNSKLNNMTQWFKKIRNKEKLKEIWELFCSKIRGHVQYYGISFNRASVQKFIFRSTKIAFKWINRRSQRKSFSWEKFRRFMDKYTLTKEYIAHPLF